MKRKRIFAALMAGIIMVGSICSSTAQAAAKWPKGPDKGSLSSASAIVMELSTGTVLYSKNIHKKHYPASITKIMTSLLTLENSSPSDVVTFTEAEAHGIETGSSSMYCVPGEKFTIEQVLYGIMLQSANEMCLVAADHVAGSVDKFVEMMNQRVAQLGLKDTHFMNPNGLHNDDHYTSAYDMACIAREAWKNPSFQKICGTRTYQVKSTNKRKASEILGGQLLNHHQMINGYETSSRYEKDYVIGGKTGYTSMAHSTLVTFAEKDGMQLVSVIMKGNSPKQGEPNEYTDTTRILDYAFEKFSKHAVNGENSDVNENLFNTFDSYFNADQSPLRLSAESAVILPKGVALRKAKQQIQYDNSVKLQDGENVIGTVKYTYDGRMVGSTDIIYDSTKSASHLDEASRRIVDSEIRQIKTNNKKHAVILQKLSGIKYSFYNMVSFFRDRVILVIVAALVILLIVLLVLNYRMNSRRKRRSRTRSRRASGGMSLNSRRSFSASKRKGRRRRGADYTSSRRTTGAKMSDSGSSISARKMKKNRKKTRESFGRSFYDFDK
ncbi:D-alanyl-D-alanine carboxypeptidase family protein [Jutongia huaianensis]|uniref:D-alanyl-D-alanine carboxypeptidase n=1 Tax=Jutongia huaianensis TaxID=2763668 RepID=A0ABR7N2R7_9FIRM|nr:D-alanyl-D-alanine carboxypeptidase family protein [Jutongia huaianensis]MBC8562342.1 D-alanyl-D-alanine carboxypeptidase [Jutongia huaianensis]